MKFYIEITLRPRPDEDIQIYFLWQKIYPQIHLGLVEIQDAQGNVSVAAAFPQYCEELNHLGCILRLFAEDKQTLESFNTAKWLNRLTDYVDIKQIQPVPENITEFVCFKRQQAKSSNERLARRKAKREGIDYEQALAQLEGYDEQRVKTPFINIKSQSTGKQFRLFIEKCSSENAQEGQFSSYGLSKIATVPWF